MNKAEGRLNDLIGGVQEFQNSVFVERRELFERLKAGQNPDALFITCSDSRINPNLITQTQPGQLFVLRNAGNIIPPYGASNGGEEATIEYALLALGIQDIIVCGHAHCGAVKALVSGEPLADTMPAVARWLRHSEATRLIVREKHEDLEGDELLMLASCQNVLTQMENLQTHPAVAVRLSQGKLKLHGWMYRFETGEVWAYEPTVRQFVPLIEPSASAGSFSVLDHAPDTPPDFTKTLPTAVQAA